VIPVNLSGEIKISDNRKCDWCKNYCKQAVVCKPKEMIKLDKCFWEEQTTEVVIYKNENILKYEFISLTIDPHHIIVYEF
jgi:pyruvate-formate lyase-activating enzyme